MKNTPSNNATSILTGGIALTTNIIKKSVKCIPCLIMPYSPMTINGDALMTQRK
jgi:hypothetical protein